MYVPGIPDHLLSNHFHVACVFSRTCVSHKTACTTVHSSDSEVASVESVF